MIQLASRRLSVRFRCRRIQLFAIVLLLGCAWLAGCSEPPPKPVAEPTPTPAPGQTPPAPTPTPGPNPSAWLADVQPFSPTLAHLFDQGCIVSLPTDEAPDAPANLPQWVYGFSYVDRYGRIYHFDARGRWWMDRGWALSEPLPPSEWDVAWNGQVNELELLVTAPYAGSASIQLFRWSDGVWRQVEPEAANAQATTDTLAAAPVAPLGRRNARRLFSSQDGAWFVAGGMVEDAVTTQVTVSLPPSSLNLAEVSSTTLASSPVLQRLGGTSLTLTPLADTLSSTSTADDDVGTTDTPPPAPLVATLVTTRTVPITYPTTQGLTLSQSVWSEWASPASDDNLTSTNLGQTVALVDGPAEEGIAVLFSSGRLWHYRRGEWLRGMELPTDRLWLAQYLPEYRQQLFVWQRGMGQDRSFARSAGTQPTSGTQPAIPAAADMGYLTRARFDPKLLTQTAAVRINEDEDGLWMDWGRVRASAQSNPNPDRDFTPGFGGSGVPAVRLSSEHGDTLFLRRDLQAIELPQQLDTLRPGAAAFVPALAGVVVPSNAGLGIDSRQEPFFPPEADDSTSSRSATLVEVIQRNYRLWVFKPTTVDFIQPPDQIHPSIGYPLSMELADGRRRFLTWNFPEPGIFRYEYRQTSQQNEQWLPSPSLTLKNLPLLEWDGEKQLLLTRPVVWGDPARIVLIGWYGRLSELINVDDVQAEGLGDDAYEQVPELAFMATVDARHPRDWTVSRLPIPFCQGAELVVDTAQDRLYLLGGKMAVPHTVRGRKLNFMVANETVWEWNGKAWSRIEPGGTAPNLKITSATGFDPTLRKVISLTPDKFYGFDGDAWARLWRTDKAITWPQQIGLYVHPISRTILGVWFEPQPRLAIWNGEDWKRVHTAAEEERRNLNESVALQHALPRRREDLVPAMDPGAFISIDADRLAAMRMDLPRDRSLDRFVEAYWVRFIPLNKASKVEGLEPTPSPTVTPDSIAPAADTPTTPSAHDAPAAADGATTPDTLSALVATDSATTSTTPSTPAPGA